MVSQVPPLLNYKPTEKDMSTLRTRRLYWRNMRKKPSFWHLGKETWENPKKTKHVNINIIIDYTLPNSFAHQVLAPKLIILTLKTETNAP